MIKVRRSFCERLLISWGWNINDSPLRDALLPTMVTNNLRTFGHKRNLSTFVPCVFSTFSLSREQKLQGTLMQWPSRPNRLRHSHSTWTEIEIKQGFCILLLSRLLTSPCLFLLDDEASISHNVQSYENLRPEKRSHVLNILALSSRQHFQFKLSRVTINLLEKASWHFNSMTPVGSFCIQAILETEHMTIERKGPKAIEVMLTSIFDSLTLDARHSFVFLQGLRSRCSFRGLDVSSTRINASCESWY